MTETLEQALRRVWETNWRHKRSGATMNAQAWKACRWMWLEHPLGTKVLPSQVDAGCIQRATAEWYQLGLSPATIQKRLSCLATLGVNVEGCKVHVPKQLKWHLRESDIVPVLACCRSNDYRSLASLIHWTTLTGLRIEESLRLTWGDFTQGFEEVSVPGTKTATSQAVLPLGDRAKSIPTGLALASGLTPNGDRLFPWEYSVYQTQWNHVREAFGWQDDPTATLKALRRSAARYLHVDCGMPLHMVQQYLRHSNMATTLEYLRLTGGYGTEEMRRYLK